MNRLAILLTAIVAITMTSCGSTKNVTYTVASQKSSCVGVAPQECLLVMKDGETEWSLFYSQIEGFEYEPGYEYVIKVKEDYLDPADVPADASSIKYTLVKMVSKTEKNSENLPENRLVTNVEKRLIVTAKLLSIDEQDVGRGAAKGKMPVRVAKLRVSTSSIDGIEPGDEIYAEIIDKTTANPQVGMEYVFIAKNLHPAHALGVYLLETDIRDLV